MANQAEGTAPQDELRRGFGLSTATYVVIASMVGTGILVSPGYMMASLGNYPAIFALWVLGGLLAICGALCVGELAAALPSPGQGVVTPCLLRVKSIDFVRWNKMATA